MQTVLRLINRKLRFSNYVRLILIRLFALPRSKQCYSTYHFLWKHKDRVELVCDAVHPIIHTSTAPKPLGHQLVKEIIGKKIYRVKQPEISSITGLVNIDRMYYFRDSVIAQNSSDAFVQLPLKKFRIATEIYVANERNFYHFLTEDIPNILILKNMGVSFTIVVPDETQWKMQILKLIGFSEHVMTSPTFCNISSEYCYFGTKNPHDSYIHPEIIRLLRETFLAKPNLHPERDVYLSRRKAPSRTLKNEIVLESMLTDIGFDIVYLEDLDFTDQVSIMTNAKRIIAPHGAGLSHLIFAHESVKILEIFSPNHVNFCYSHLTDVLGQSYNFLYSDSVDDMLIKNVKSYVASTS